MARIMVALRVAAVAAAVSACAAPAEEATAEEDLRAARCEKAYAAPMRAKVAKARARLDRSTTTYAATVREALDRREVKLLPFCAMTRADFEKMADEDTDLTAGGATRDEQYRRLRDGDEAVMRSLHNQMYGYMWEDRVYLASTMSEARTLETIAHEVRHVLRKAHLKNYDDQRNVCVEELEGARAERLVDVDVITPEEDRALLDRVHELYELDKLARGTCGYR